MKYNFKDLLSENKRELKVVVKHADTLNLWHCDVSDNTPWVVSRSSGTDFYVEVLP